MVEVLKMAQVFEILLKVGILRTEEITTILEMIEAELMVARVGDGVEVGKTRRDETRRDG